MEGGLYRTKQGGLDYSHDFFGKAAFLTVSGQLQAEYFATALSNVYTFAPTFRAEGMRSFPWLKMFLPAQVAARTVVDCRLVKLETGSLNLHVHADPHLASWSWAFQLVCFGALISLHV